MFKFGVWLTALVALAAGMARAAPLEAYGELPTISDATVAPDGSAFAVVLATAGQETLLVRKLADGSSARFGLGDAKVRGLEWVGSQDLVLTTSKTSMIFGVSGPRRENLMGFHINLPTAKLDRLLGSSPARMQTGTHISASGKDADVAASLNILVRPPEVRIVAGSPTLFLKGIAFQSNQGVLTVFRTDLQHGTNHVVELGRRDTDDILLGEDGEPLAETTYDDKSGRWALKLRRGGGWKEVRTLEALNDRPYLVGLGRDGLSALVGERQDRGFLLREVSVDGVWSAPLEVDDEAGPLFDPRSHRLIGTHALLGDEDRYTFFDANDRQSWNSVRAAFKGSTVKLVSWSDDRRRIIVIVDSPTEGPAYAFVDLNQKKASYIGPLYMGLGSEQISPVAPIRFKARDGLELTGYLTTPKGPVRNLPLVVFPHGGPATRDRPGFDWWAQAMASRGYAVLQVNFRGSEGFGWDFLTAGFGQWGRKMQTDLSDGVAYFAHQGTIDPKRVCIVGGSYGGYAALAGSTLDPGVYRCVVSVAGVSDLRRQVLYSREHGGRSAERYWTRFMGAEDPGDPVLAKLSPAKLAANADAPILLIHGSDDTVVPIEQSRIMANALKAAGKPVELVELKSDDHWLSRGATRLQMLQATVAFLEKNNPPN